MLRAWGSGSLPRGTKTRVGGPQEKWRMLNVITELPARTAGVIGISTRLKEFCGV